MINTRGEALTSLNTDSEAARSASVFHHVLLLSTYSLSLKQILMTELNNSCLSGQFTQSCAGNVSVMSVLGTGRVGLSDCAAGAGTGRELQPNNFS